MIVKRTAFFKIFSNTNRCLFFIFLSFFAFQSHDYKQEEKKLLGTLNPNRECYNVHFYELWFDFNIAKKRIVATSDIHAWIEKDTDTIQVDLKQNLEILSIQDSHQQQALSYTRKHRAILIPLKKKQGSHLLLRIKYQGKPQIAQKPPWKGGFVWYEDKEKNPWVGVACQGDGASIWWPNKDHLSDKPDSLSAHFTVPHHLKVVSNGKLKSKKITGEKVTYHWHTSYPINNYNVTFYIGNFTMFNKPYKSHYGQSMDLSYYVLPYHLKKAREHFKQVNNILHFLEEKLGPYPWFNDGFKLVESPYLGMEHQSAIAYGMGYQNDPVLGIDHIIIHEAAHEWWGNSVTVKDLSDVWIHEGFASYMEALYAEENRGKQFFQTILSAFKGRIQEQYTVLGRLGYHDFDAIKNANPYFKGAWIIQGLRGQMDDDELFFKLIKSFVQNHKDSPVDTESFIQWVNKTTKKDYRSYFNFYLKEAKIPELLFFVDKQGKFYFKWSNVPDTFKGYFIEFLYKRKKYRIIPSSDIQSIAMDNWQKNKIDDLLFQPSILFKPILKSSKKL